MHLADPIFIFILALVLLGPKRTGELAQQLGKLMGEFRKASNDFKFQFTEEMRISEQQEQLKKQEGDRAALGAGATTADGENRIEPPAPLPVERAADEVAAPVPYAISAVSATTGEETPVEDHPLLRVDVIPPMDTPPVAPTIAPPAAPPVTFTEASILSPGPTPVEVPASAHGNGHVAHPDPAILSPEPHESPVHHG